MKKDVTLIILAAGMGRLFGVEEAIGRNRDGSTGKRKGLGQ